MKYTPMVKQYLEIKKQYQDAILFFRLGDFYEMFFEDAKLASRELEITLTGRDGGEAGRIPMCGVPYHSADSYIGKLVGKGYRVAICEQVEDPQSTKGIVRREVVRVITPGTILEGELLEDKKNNFIIAVACNGMEKDKYGLAVSDVSTGLFTVTEFSGLNAQAELFDEIERLKPAEAVLPEKLANNKKFESFFKNRLHAIISKIDDEEIFTYQAAFKYLNKYIKKPENLSKLRAVVCAAGALLYFLENTQKRVLKHIVQATIYYPGKYMTLDTATRRNLELTSSIRDGFRRGTLLWVLDHTVTAMGGRLLKTWIEQPLTDITAIEARLSAVHELVKDSFLRQDLIDLLNKIYDLERLTGRASFGTANARDLLALKKSLQVLPSIKNLLDKTNAGLLKKIKDKINPLDDLQVLLEKALEENPPTGLREGGLIKSGFHKEVDNLRNISKNGKKWLSDLEVHERHRTGIKSLKIGYNKVFGYYIEITKPNLSLVPPEYRRKQTLANAERFITEELKEYENKILGANEKLMNLEYHLFLELRERAAIEAPHIQQTARAIAQLDVLVSLAEAAVRENYTRPEVTADGKITIKRGRHPVVEKVMGTSRYIPNDTTLDNDNKRLALITGPNMAGKSTYMRQVALIVLMAQMGSFVPAEAAQISICDRIFTRVGASDDLAGGESTFMVEMKECCTIVKNATSRSLIIMDEVGRGTSTYDGISIARALIEYIHNRIKAKTIFSTHYHELTDLDVLPGIINYTVAVKEKDKNIIFLHKVVPGKADRSYGIHVARLAGLPEEILARSEEILEKLEIQPSPEEIQSLPELHNEGKKEQPLESPVVWKQNCPQADLSGKDLPQNIKTVVEKINALNILTMTPLQAINKLHELQEMLQNGSPENILRKS